MNTHVGVMKTTTVVRKIGRHIIHTDPNHCLDVTMYIIYFSTVEHNFNVPPIQLHSLQQTKGFYVDCP